MNEVARMARVIVLDDEYRAHLLAGPVSLMQELPRWDNRLPRFKIDPAWFAREPYVPPQVHCMVCGCLRSVNLDCVRCDKVETANTHRPTHQGYPTA